MRSSVLNWPVEKIKIHTKRYAKRQETWFRKWPFIRWFNPEEQTEEEILELILQEIEFKLNKQYMMQFLKDTFSS